MARQGRGLWGLALQIAVIFYHISWLLVNSGNGELSRQTLPFALTARIVLDKA